MANKDDNSQERRGSCLGALLVPLMGLIVIWVGYGMWRNPHLDWKSFWVAGAEGVKWVADEVVRLWNDPFAVLGIAVMVGGLIIILYGIRRLFRRS